MQVGRNDPCPCGSGKKYKKCCMEKDLAAERVERVVTSPPPKLKQKTWADFEHLKVNDFIEDDFDEDEEEEPEKFVDPRQIALFGEEEFPPVPQPLLKLADYDIEDDDIEDDDIDIATSNERWDEFEAAGYEKKIAIFLLTLEEKKQMDDQMAFDMLSTIYPEAIVKNQRDRCIELIHKLNSELPEAYEGHAVFYLDWMIETAVIASRHDDVNALLKELAPIADRQIDIFNEVLDRLAYHGYQSQLFEAMKTAWTKIKALPDILPWGITAFAERAINFAVFEYIETHPEINISDAELLKMVKEFGSSAKMKNFTRYMEHVSGKVTGQWILEDFDPKSKQLRSDPEKRPKVLARENLYYLSLEFLCYLHQQEHIQFSKGQLAQQQLLEYFDQRFKEELVEEPGMLEKMKSPGKRKPRKQPIPEHILCPDAVTLNVFLGRFLNFFDPEPYKLAATIELIPVWLRFLEIRQLIEKDMHEKAINEIKENLIEMLLNIYDQVISDPILKKNLVKIWQA